MASEPMEKPPADPFAQISGSYSNPEKFKQLLAWAQDSAHVISPAFSCARLPEGCSLAVSVVWINPDTDAHDVGMGKLGLLKHALAKVATAAGVRFDPHASGRLDNGADPYYVHYQAVGAWRHLDGSIIPIMGDKEMDLREGSAQVERIRKQSRDADKQIREMRAFILGHAQSKAELRAIRKALGIRSYTKDELRKPFVVASLQFTGYSDDPVIRRENAAAIRNSMLGGAQALFGPPTGNTVPSPALPVAHNVPVQLTSGHAPPPVGSTHSAEFARSQGAHALPPAIDTTATPVPDSSRAPRTISRQSPPPQPKSDPAMKDEKRPTSSSDEPVARFGRSAGKPLSEMDDESFAWYLEAVRGNVEDPKKARYKAENEAHLAEVLAEEDRRNGVVDDDDGDDDADRY